jgi:hypothetical protein
MLPAQNPNNYYSYSESELPLQKVCGKSQQADYQSSQIFWLGSQRPAIEAFMMDKVIVLTIDVTIRSIDSSSPGLCHENS